MGVLLSGVAVRNGDLDEVVDVFLSIVRGVGHRAEALAGPHRDTESSDVLCTSSPGWVTLVPHYVVPPERLAAEMTRRLDTVASAITVYEDVFWTHHLVDRGHVVDSFANLPGYFGEQDYVHGHEGDPDLVAAGLGADASAIAPYFRQISVRRARSTLLPAPKAHRDDEYDLLDGWVVVELWRRMGIAWPDPSGSATTRIPLGRDAMDALSSWLRGS
ncbi:hypothetical protein CFI00_00065 [Nocardioides sp. S5]|nr:hypothetical protein CFI00_00065 [Nocardioides sp. S5]